MRHLLLAGVMVLSTSGTSTAGATPTALPDAPITVTFVDAHIEDVLTFLARHAGFTLEMDASVTDEIRHSRIPEQPIRLTNTTVAEALDTITSLTGLTYTIVGPRTIRIARTV